MIKNISVLGRAEHQSPEELNPGCDPTHTYNMISTRQACVGTSRRLTSKRGRDKWHTDRRGAARQNDTEKIAVSKISGKEHARLALIDE
jgi:hypothetical protein